MLAVSTRCVRGDSAQSQRSVHLIDGVGIVGVFLVITNSRSKVFLWPAVQLVSCSSFGTFLKRLHRLLVEGGGERGCASLCAARAKLEGFYTGGGDVVGVILAKLGKCNG